MSKDWNQKKLRHVEDCLCYYGDLLLKSGQAGIHKAIKSLPSDPDKMNDWCKKWLTDDGLKKLFKCIKKARSK